jgi:hypothetical protein
VIRPAQEGYNFNDVLKQEGVLKVSAYVQETTQSGQISTSIDDVNFRSQQSNPTEKELLTKTLAEPQGEAKKTQTQEVELSSFSGQEPDPLPKIIESDKPLAVQTGPTQDRRDSQPDANIIEPTPSVEAYQSLLKQRRVLSQRGNDKNPQFLKDREVIQDKINVMAYELIKDPHMMAKAKEIDIHMSIERMATLQENKINTAQELQLKEEALKQEAIKAAEDKAYIKAIMQSREDRKPQQKTAEEKEKLLADNTPSVEGYQALLKQRRHLSERGEEEDLQLVKDREIIQDKIYAMAHQLIQDPQMMSKAKEVDMHMSIERMAAYHDRPKQIKEVKLPHSTQSETLTSSKDKEHPPLIQEYIELQETRRKIGFATLAKTSEQAAQCREVAKAIEITAYKISQNAELCSHVQSNLPKLYEGIQVQAGFHEAELKPRLTKSIDYEM